MKTKYLLLIALIVVFGSCSTAYRTGQTPDDVYYSPTPQVSGDAYVRSDNQKDRETYAYNNTYNNEDMEIRRGIRDIRYRNNVMIDLSYGYNPYSYNSFGYYNPYNSFYNPYNNYYNPHSYYNPYAYSYNPYSYNYYDPYYSNYFISPYYNYYYSPQVYVSPKPGGIVTSSTGARRYNLGAYNNNRNTINASSPSSSRVSSRVNSSSAPVRTVRTPSTNNNDRRGVGNFIRRVFTPDNDNNSNRVYRSDNNSNNSYNNSNSSPVRTTSTQSGSSSSNSSSGSSSAPSRTFRK